MTVRVTSRGLRVLRGLVVATLSVTIAAFSHVAGGGLTPGVLGTVLALAFAVLISIALSGRALSLPPLAAAVVASQVVFHLLFSLGAALPASARGVHVGMLGMVMSGGSTATLPDLGSSTVSAVEGLADARMWIGHLAAAVVTIMLLLHGERALVTVVRLAVGRLAVFVRVVVAPPALARHRVLAALGDRSGLRSLDVLLATRPHRGPPVGI